MAQMLVRGNAVTFAQALELTLDNYWNSFRATFQDLALAWFVRGFMDPKP